MKRFLSKALLAGAAAAGLAAVVAPTPAEAQFFVHPYYRPFHFQLNLGRPLYVRPPVAEELTPREIAAAVARQGFRDVSRPYYEDDVAVVTATGRSGQAAEARRRRLYGQDRGRRAPRARAPAAGAARA